MWRETFQRALQRMRLQQRAVRHASQRTQHVFQMAAAAQAATAASRQQAGGVLVHAFHFARVDVHHIAFQLLVDGDAADIARARHAPFGQRETVGKVFQVRWRGHHHREGFAVVAQLHRRFLGQPVLALAQVVALADGDMAARESGARHGGQASAGSRDADNRTGIDL